MTKKEQTAYERALERAAQDGVCIVLDGGNHWQVCGSNGVTLFTVQTTTDGLRCACPSRHYCKHLAVCQQRLNEQQAEREQHAAEAGMALALAERSERTLAGQTYSQEERLRALAYLPVAIAAYVVVLGPVLPVLVLFITPRLIRHAVFYAIHLAAQKRIWSLTNIKRYATVYKKEHISRKNSGYYDEE